MTVKRLEILSKNGAIPQTVWDKLSFIDEASLMLRSGWSWEIPEGVCITSTNNDLIFMFPDGGEDIHITFCDKTNGIDNPLKPYEGFEGMLNPDCKVSVIITDRKIEDVSDDDDYDKMWIGDMVDTFVIEFAERDDRSPGTTISYREGRGCGCIRLALIDDYIPKASIMMFDMSELTTLEQDILISMFEGRCHER